NDVTEARPAPCPIVKTHFETYRHTGDVVGEIVFKKAIPFSMRHVVRIALRWAYRENLPVLNNSDADHEQEDLQPGLEQIPQASRRGIRTRDCPRWRRFGRRCIRGPARRAAPPAIVDVPARVPGTGAVGSLWRCGSPGGTDSRCCIAHASGSERGCFG